MSHASDTLVVGKIGAPYGVKGWVKINSYTVVFDGTSSYEIYTVGQHEELTVVQ